jgi:hypothetical protein
MDLPIDLILHILRIMLDAPEGCINPWLTKEEGYYSSSIQSSFLAWKRPLRPNILATCRVIYNLGTPILYGNNTLRLINRLALGEKGKKDFSEKIKSGFWNLDENKCQIRNKMTNFFTYPHRVFDPSGCNSKMLRRCELIKHLKIQRSEIDYDDLAAKGVSRVLKTKRWLDGQICITTDKVHEEWGNFHVLRFLEGRKMDLRTLTFTFDEEDERMLELLKLETQCRKLQENQLPQTRELRIGFYLKHFCVGVIYRDRIICKKHDSAADFVSFGQNMKVQTLYIREAGLQERDGGTSHFMQEVTNWLSATKITPEKVIFSGPFKERKMTEDGFLVPEGENWRAIDMPLP